MSVIEKLIPSNWLDPLLSGPGKVIHKSPGHEIEALLNALRDRLKESPELRQDMIDARRLAAFAAAILPMDEDFIGDVDGGALQDAAEAAGLLQAVEVTEPCGDGCNCAGYGDFPQTCYRPTDTLSRAIKAARATGEGEGHD